MEDSLPDTDSDSSEIDIAAIENEIERSLTAGIDHECLAAIQQYRMYVAEKKSLKKNKSSTPDIIARKRAVKKDRRNAISNFIKVSKKYEKDAIDFLNFATLSDQLIRSKISTFSNEKNKRIIILICSLLSRVATKEEAMVFSVIGGKTHRILVNSLVSHIDRWYKTFINESDLELVSTHPMPSEVPQNTIETAHQEFTHTNPVENPMPTEVPMDNTIKCRYCGGDHWTLSCPKKTMNVDSVYKTLEFNQKKLPSLKQAMADVESATGILYNAKYILERVISQQEESLKVAKQMIQSLE
jgi:hypothetical protein